MDARPCPFHISKPIDNNLLPIIISIPHSGVEFPEEVKEQFHSDITKHPDDTDWFVDKLYDFATTMGITIIKARYSRYVIDLNRDPKNKPLYKDGRHITSLLPTSTFNEKDIYINTLPSSNEVDRRLTQYYWPYYQEISRLLSELRQNFPHVLLFDAHSIKRFVPTISKEKFPSLILGNQNHKTAHHNLIQCGLESLRMDDKYDVSDNFPFVGGHITRYFGQPSKGIHTLQLEMSQDIYMDEEKTEYDEKKAPNVQKLLRSLFFNLNDTLRELL